MEKKEELVKALVVLVCLVAIYFLGTSVTGLVVQSMHCENGICNEICSYNSECSLDSVCCNENGVGVCKEQCFKLYEQPVQVETNNSRNIFQSPAINKMVMVNITLGCLLLVGLVYVAQLKKPKKR